MTNIRPIRAEDLTILSRTLVSGDPKKHSRRMEMQDRGDVTYLIAWEGTKPVGHVMIRWKGTEEKAPRRALPGCPHMEDLAVIETRRGRGIGSTLVAAAENAAREKGMDMIGLAVALDNPDAERLYRRLGYRDADIPPYESRWSFTDASGKTIEIRETDRYLVKEL